MILNKDAIEIGLMKKKMSAADLANAIGKNRATVWRIISGKNTSYTTAGKIAEALDISPEELVKN